MNLKHEASSEAKVLLRKKRSRYNPVNNELREKLIEMVNTEKFSLKKASEILQLNYNTAKTILRIWKKESRINKKKKKKNLFKTKFKKSKQLKNLIDVDYCFKKEEMNENEIFLKNKSKSNCDNDKINFNNMPYVEQSLFCNNINDNFNSPLKCKIKKRKRLSCNDLSKFPQISCNGFNSINYLNQTFINNFGLKAGKDCEFSNRYISANNNSFNRRLFKSSFFDLKINSFFISYLHLNNKNEFFNYNYGRQLMFNYKDTKDFTFSPKNNINNNEITINSEFSFLKNFKFNKVFLDDFSLFNEITKTDSFSIINMKSKLKYNCENHIYFNYYNNNINNINNNYNSSFYLHCKQYFSFNFKEFFDKYFFKNIITFEDIQNEKFLDTERKCIFGELLKKINELNENVFYINQYLSGLFDGLFPFNY